jgi:hypothetical protein
MRDGGRFEIRVARALSLQLSVVSCQKGQKIKIAASWGQSKFHRQREILVLSLSVVCG